MNQKVKMVYWWKYQGLLTQSEYITFNSILDELDLTDEMDELMLAQLYNEIKTLVRIRRIKKLLKK